MKFVIKEKFPKTLSLDPKHKPEYETVSTTIELPDHLVGKGIAVIDELLDRTWDELENLASENATFPLIPFPFFKKYREPENLIGDYWISVWLDSTLEENIRQRTEIIEFLDKMDGLTIKKNPSVSLEIGHFEGEKFVVSLNRNKLSELREKLSKGFLKLKESGIEIDVETVDYLEGLFLLRTLYDKIIQILEVACDGYVTYRNPQLNYFYVTFSDTVDKLLSRKEFEDLRKDKPQLFESLVGDIQDNDIYWEHLSQEAYSFFGKIETLFIRKGSKYFKPNSALQEKLRSLDETMEEHRKTSNKAFSKMLEQADKQALSVKQQIDNTSEQPKPTPTKSDQNKQSIEFDDGKPAIIVNGTEVKIPYGTNQHNLCRALFDKKKKRWENDELLMEFGLTGDEPVKRQPYDAMLAVNEKVKKKTELSNLILHTNKTFQLNPKYF